MRPRPDLSLPSLPDAEELDAEIMRARRARDRAAVEHGGMNLREEPFEWPESGPSGSSKVKGNELPIEEAILSPFKAKIIASMIGAASTSLLSKSIDKTSGRCGNFADIQ